MSERTPLQKAILYAMDRFGPMKSEDLAYYTGKSVRAVASSLMYLRGEGLVNDGSVHYHWPSGGNGCMHTPPTPRTWALGPILDVQGPCPYNDVNQEEGK